MKNAIRFYVLAAILALTLTGCGDTPAQPAQPTNTTGGSEATAGAATTPTSAQEASPTTAQGTGSGTGSQGSGNASVIDVVVTGGPDAGTYQRRSSRATCSANLTEDGSWGNQYSDPDIKEGLSSLQLIVRDMDEAATSTSNFLTTFTFGDFLSANARTYSFNGTEDDDKKGKSGTVTLDDRGQTGKVTLNIETEEGVKIDATIQCNEIVRGLAAQATNTPGPQDETAKLSVTLSGGEPEGTFEATSTEGATCGYGPESGSILVDGLEDPSDVFTIEYYKEGDPLNKFWLLIASKAEAVSSTGTQKFYVEVNEDQSYYIDNQDGPGADGTGTVKIQEKGDSATVTLDATSSNGRNIKATIECKVVKR